MRNYLLIIALLLLFGVDANPQTNEFHPESFAEKLSRDVREAYRTAQSDPPFTYEATLARRQENAGVARGIWITIDTSDQEACFETHRSLRSFRSTHSIETPENFCKHDPLKPQMSIVLVEPINAREFRRDLDLTPLKTTEQNLVTDTRNLALTMVGAMGILWLLPESTTKWKKDEIRNSKYGIFSKYFSNIKNGPVVDRDNPVYNWIGHPLSGAAYYVIARHHRLSSLQAFGYSVVMSTFFWEYGLEAIAEVPSLQDLIITPVMGSILGELFYRAELHIKANDEKLFGSKRLGRLAMVILNPMATISREVNQVLGSKVIQDASGNIYVRQEERNGQQVTTLGIQLRFTFY